ncbi:MAG: TlpA family protein disulfide reductase [Nannocystales bacterium]
MKRILFASCWLVLGCDVSASQPTDTAKTPQTRPLVVSEEQPGEAEPKPEPEPQPEPVPADDPEPAAALSVVELKPSAGPLQQQLRLHAKRGANKGQRVVLEMGAPWCPPCKRAKALLAEDGVKAQLGGVILLRADSDVWGEDLDDLGFDAPVIPVYYALDSGGGPSGDSARGDRWKSREQVRKGLLAFLRGE